MRETPQTRNINRQNKALDKPLPVLSASSESKAIKGTQHFAFSCGGTSAVVCGVGTGERTNLAKTVKSARNLQR